MTAARRAVAAVLCLAAAAAAWAGKPAEPEGVRWEPDVDAALERAAREGRPVLVALNALENEGANNRLATSLYPSRAWGEGTRGFVCLVANPNDHPGEKGACARYGRIPCEAHKRSVALLTQRFGGDLISPQHVILEPDGDVAWRKEYFSDDVGPALLEAWLSRVAPRIAVRRAALAREARVAALERAPAGKAEELAKEWLAEDDGLAVAGVVSALESTDDGARALRLVAALATARSGYLPVLVDAAEGVLLEPDDDAALSARWAATLAAVDSKAAAPTLARAAMRWKDKARAASVVALFEEADPAAAREVRLLRGERVGKASGDDASPRVRRAEVRAGLRPRAGAGLDAAFAAGRPGEIRAALLEATAEEVRADRERVARTFAESPYERVRIAAGLALLRARVPAGGLVGSLADALLAARVDLVEGPETLREAVSRLGKDPGRSDEAWRAALAAALGGGR